jgi:preprotein translocase subunit SecG
VCASRLIDEKILLYHVVKKEVVKMELALGIILLVLAVALVALVMFQESKDTKLSSSIAGGSDTFFGKSKGASKDKLLSWATGAVAIVFAIVVLVMYLVF